MNSKFNCAYIHIILIINKKNTMKTPTTKKELKNVLENTTRWFTIKKNDLTYNVKWDIDYFKIIITNKEDDEKIEELSSTDDVVDFFTPILCLK